jgi:hypothetical protein
VTSTRTTARAEPVVHRAPEREPDAPVSAMASLQRSLGNQAMWRLLSGWVPAPVDRVLRGQGTPLAPQVRGEMEARFGNDLADVRVYTGAPAAAAAESVGARAFALGSDVVFGRGQLDVVTTPGRILLAHELAHVIQQRRGGPAPAGPAREGLERAGNRAAESAIRNAGPVRVEGASARGIARQPKGDPGTLPELKVNPIGGGAFIVTLEGVLIFQVEVPEDLADAQFGFKVIPKDNTLAVLVEGDRRVHVLQQPPAIAELAAKGYDTRVFDNRRSMLGEHPELPEIRLPRPSPPPGAKPKPKARPKTQAPPAPKPKAAPKEPARPQPVAPPVTETPQEFRPLPEPEPTAPPPKPDDIIEAHTSFVDLDEEKLGGSLLDHARQGREAYVQEVLDALGTFDRDDVSVAFAEAATDDDLRRLASTEEGRRLLDRLFDELTEGEVGEDEQKQANRILAIKTRYLLTETEFAEGIEKAKDRIVLPYRKPGLTVMTPSPIHASRTEKGKIWVKLRTDIYGTDYYYDKDIHLPDRIWEGVELEETDIVGVKFYDDEGRIDFFPALYLLQLHNESTRVALHKMGEAFGLGLTLGAGSVVGAGGEGAVAVGELSTAGRVLYYGGRALTILDHVAVAVDLANSVIQEHRSWILEQTGGEGRELIKAFDRVNSYLQVYGLARGAVGLVKLAAGLRKTYLRWRALTRTLEEGMSEGDKVVVSSIGNSTEDMLKEMDNLASAPAETTARPPATTASEVPPDLPSLEPPPAAKVEPPVTHPDRPMKAVPGTGKPRGKPRGKLSVVASEGKPVLPKEPPPSEPQSADIPLAEEVELGAVEQQPAAKASGAPGAERFVRPQAIKGSVKPPKPPAAPAPVVPLKPRAAGTGSVPRRTPARPSSAIKELPSPSELEKSVGKAVASNVKGLDPATNFNYQNRNLNTIAEDLAARQAQLQELGKGSLLPQVDTSIMDLSAADFMKRHPSLQKGFDDLLQRAMREKNLGNDALYEEMSKFLSEGRMRTRRPDTIEVRLDQGQVSLTDPTIKTDRAKVIMHEFKTRFYGEAMRDILGSQGPTVSAFEHNPALGIHRPAR